MENRHVDMLNGFHCSVTTKHLNLEGFDLGDT